MKYFTGVVKENDTYKAVVSPCMPTADLPHVVHHIITKLYDEWIHSPLTNPNGEQMPNSFMQKIANTVSQYQKVYAVGDNLKEKLQQLYGYLTIFENGKLGCITVDNGCMTYTSTNLDFEWTENIAVTLSTDDMICVIPLKDIVDIEFEEDAVELEIRIALPFRDVKICVIA